MMLKTPISITAIASISPLGTSLVAAWQKYENKNHCLSQQEFSVIPTWVGKLSENVKQEVEVLRLSDSKYKNLDNSVLYALYASRNAMKIAGWKSADNFGINIGSSRGATSLFEKYYEEFLKKNTTSTLSSPTTTLGNISSWVAHDLGTKGPEISHSITCSTALHALLNGVAWIKSGMANKFLVGGSEAPLTPFTIAQMRALKIYASPVLSSRALRKSSAQAPSRGIIGNLIEVEYPCKALDLSKDKNTMVLGEGASMVCLEDGVKDNALATIIGVGYATETLKHNISISSDAQCFQDSMKMALGTIKPEEVDVIVMHAPGTVKGDLSEKNAINKVFCNKTPSLTTNKWKIGHTFGTSGMLSLELAVLMLQHQKFIPVPFVDEISTPKKIQKVLVNAVGFGGNAVSILLSK